MGSHSVEFTLTEADNSELCSCKSNNANNYNFTCDNECQKYSTGAGFTFTVDSDTVTETTRYYCSVKVNTKGGVDEDAAEDKKMIYAQFVGEFRYLFNKFRYSFIFGQGVQIYSANSDMDREFRFVNDRR